jgi:hypothetical protein
MGNKQFICRSGQLGYIEEAGKGALCKAGFLDVVVEVCRLKQWEDGSQDIIVADGVGRPQDSEMVAFVAQEDGGTCAVDLGRWQVKNMVTKSVDVKCYAIESRIVLYDQNGAFPSFKGGEEIEVGSFKHVSEAPATSPLMRGRVEKWGRKGREEMLV